MLPFIRSDLATFTAYTPQPGGHGAPSDAVDCLDTNESPRDLPAPVKAAIAQTYQQTIAANRYPDGSHAELKQQVATYVDRSAQLPPGTIAPTQISMGNGSDELIRSVLIATCLGGEGSILVAKPTFSMYGILAQTLGIPVRTVGRSPETMAMDLAAAQQELETPGDRPVRAVFVVHPNSPTGNALSPAELAWLRQLPAHILVVIDEAYFEFSGTSVVGELAHHPNWIILRTFSKAFRLAAHRVGYAIAHPEVINILEKLRLPYNLPSLSQVAALTALAHQDELLAQIPEIVAERSQLQAALQSQSHLYVWPSAANFLFLTPVSTAAQSSLDPWFTTLMQQGTRIRHTAGGLRITIGTPAENQRTRDRLLALLT